MHRRAASRHGANDSRTKPAKSWFPAKKYRVYRRLLRSQVNPVCFISSHFFNALHFFSQLHSCSPRPAACLKNSGAHYPPTLMYTTNLRCFTTNLATCLFGSQASSRARFLVSWEGGDYGGKSGSWGSAQTYCTMNYYKPSANLSANSAAEQPALSEQENAIDPIAATPNLVFTPHDGPKDLSLDESDDLLRTRIKESLPVYTAPTDLKDRIRRISSLGRD